MGRGGRLFWEVAVAAMMVTAILCSKKCEAAAVAAAGRGRSYGGNLAVELMMVGSRIDIFPLLPRFRNFEGDEPITDQTNNPNAGTCSNGAGNANGACGGDPNNKNNCPKYDPKAPCPA